MTVTSLTKYQSVLTSDENISALKHFSIPLSNKQTNKHMLNACLLYAGQTERRVRATESKGVGEGHPPAPSPPRLRSTGDVVQVKLRVGAVQVEGGRNHPVVASQGRKCCFQGAGGPQQMSRGPFSGRDGQALEVLLEEPLDGGVFGSIAQRGGGGVSIHVRYFCRTDAGVAESRGHAPAQTGAECARLIFITRSHLSCKQTVTVKMWTQVTNMVVHLLPSSPERSVAICRRRRDVAGVTRESVTQNLRVDPGSSRHCTVQLL